MKKFLLLLLISVTSFAQTTIDLSGLTGNISLGQNCSSSQSPEEFITTGDTNLNDFVVTLRNAKLIITGNLNGSGSIVRCGQSQSLVCVNGSIQNNPVIEDGLLVNCSVLSVDNFDFINLKENTPYKVYNISGQLLHEGITGDKFILPKHVVLIEILIVDSKYKKRTLIKN